METPTGSLLDMSAGTLIILLLVSSVGFGLFLYGKKERRAPQLVAGVALMGFPYIVSGALAMVGIATLVVGGMWLAVRAGA